jgi:hypothetical protein
MGHGSEPVFDERLAVSRTDSSVVSWLEMTDRRLRDLLTAADLAYRDQRPRHRRAAPAADGFRSALQSLQQWTVHHPCPDPAFAGRFQVLLARYGFISLVTEDEASLDDGASSSAVVRRLRVLNVDLRDFLDDLEEHQREQRCGEPLD